MPEQSEKRREKAPPREEERTIRKILYTQKKKRME